ncbi:MAG: hypothetical protein JWM33_757 [Caulobacteraceae bacterium]|nr:hypothetical protein [Caulobacteraceae bacterium]
MKSSIAAAVVCFVIIAASYPSSLNAAVASPMTGAAPGYMLRNQSNFLMRFQGDITPGAGLVGASFTIAECPKASCYHLSGAVKLPLTVKASASLNVGAFPIAGTECDLQFEEVIKNGMDSPDWKLILVSKDRAGRGCARIPAALAGVYKA